MAANRPELVAELTQLFSTAYVFVRPAMNEGDVRGVQLGGALKNIYALATGLLDGYYESRLGGNCDNSLFHVSNRFVREMTAIGTALGGKPETFNGLSGMTDLMLACFGADARDRQYAHDFVNGKADPGHRSSGIFGIRALPNLINLNPDDYPVAYAVYAVIVKGMEGEKVLESIMYSLRKF
jgi:glycerol-3-phosphate dehydrogenase